MGYLSGVYCDHYNSLENVFKERKKYIQSLETQIAKSIDKVEEQKLDNIEKAIELEKQVQATKEAQSVVKAKISQVK